MIVFEGDSQTVGSWAPHPPDIDVNPPTYYGQTFDKFNNGHPGYTLTQMQDNMAASVNPHFTDTAPLNIVVLWGGTNDIAQGASGEVAYNHLVAYATALRAFGWKVLVNTLVSIRNYNPQRNAFNSLVYANHASFSDGLIDLAYDPRIGLDSSCDDIGYFQADGTHLNENGCHIVGYIEQDAITNFIGSAGKTGFYVGRSHGAQRIPFPASGTFGDASCLTLTTGEWDLSAVLSTSSNGSSISTIQTGIGTGAGNNSAGLVSGDNYLSGLPPTPLYANNITIPSWRVSVVGIQTFYQKVLATYATGQPDYTYRFSARRVN